MQQSRTMNARSSVTGTWYLKGRMTLRAKVPTKLCQEIGPIARRLWCVVQANHKNLITKTIIKLVAFRFRSMHTTACLCRLRTITGLLSMPSCRLCTIFFYKGGENAHVSTTKSLHYSSLSLTHAWWVGELSCPLNFKLTACFSRSRRRCSESYLGNYLVTYLTCTNTYLYTSLHLWSCMDWTC